MSPTLIVVASSPAGVAIAGHLFAIAGAELPNPSFKAWQDQYGHSPESAQARHALAARQWPAVITVDSTAAELLAPMARTWPDARFLFLVEEPATSLAIELPLPDGFTIGAWSAKQGAAAQRILRHSQRHPDRSLCLLARELARDPQAAKGLLWNRMGAPLPVASHPVPYALPSQLNLALASMLLATERQLASSAAELLASCPPLGETPADGELALPDRGLVLSELATLTERAAIAPGLQTRIAELEHRIGQLDRLLAESEQARTEAAARLTRLGAEHEDARIGSESLLANLQRVQERLNQETQGKRELAAARTEARRLATQIEELTTQNERLAAARAAADGACLDLEAQIKQHQLDKTLLMAEMEQLKAALSKAPAPAAIDALRRDNELLLVHLHQVQEELEQVALENHSLAQRTGSGAGGPPLSFDECQVERVRDVKPHLELELRLRDVRLGDEHAFEHLRMRLVEHHAHPGIVFVHDPSLPRQYLSSWVETGREGDVPYMLIVPSDTAGRTVLQTLPTSDWDALLALAHRLSGELSEATATEATPWPGVARHLARQLAELSPRLRYDGLEVEPDNDGYAICFENLVFGPRRFEQLRLLWQPNAALPLAVLAPPSEGNPPPLDEWPSNGEGKREPRLPVPVGKLGFLSKRRQWVRLTAMDRGLLLALLDALPAVAQAGQTQRMINGDQAHRLRVNARRLLRDALAASGQRESLWRRVVGRLRARWR